MGGFWLQKATGDTQSKRHDLHAKSQNLVTETTPCNKSGKLSRSGLFIVQAGSDARVVSKLTFDLSSGKPVGKQELVPVVTGSCEKYSKVISRGAR
eukprot:584123-Amphidinium_carterae.1